MMRAHTGVLAPFWPKYSNIFTIYSKFIEIDPRRYFRNSDRYFCRSP